MLVINNLGVKLSFLLSILVLIFISTIVSAKDLELIKEKSFNVQPGQLLSVKTDVGDIIIKTWNNNEVLVKIYGDRSAKAKMEFSFDQTENSIVVIGEKEGGNLFSWFSRIDLKYEIKVPKSFDLDLKTSGGDLVAKNIKGEFSLKTSGGDIYFKNANGNLNAATSGGDITLGDFNGNSDVSTSGGDIEINSENGNVYAATSGGDIFLNSSNGEVKAKTSGGDIKLNYFGENSGISLITSGGDIDVKLPYDLNADVDIKSSGGDLTSNFSKNKMSKISKSKLVGKFNNGGNQLVCKTSGGDITVYEK
jgi:Toastrack DUF4097